MENKSGFITLLLILLLLLHKKVHYEQTQNKLHRKIVQCVQAIEQLRKVLKLFHQSQIAEETIGRDKAPLPKHTGA